MVLASVARDAAHDHVAETRAVRPATGAALLERHARQKLYVVVGFLDVEPLELLGSDRDDAQRDILQILGALLRRHHDLLETAAGLLLRKGRMERGKDCRGDWQHPDRRARQLGLSTPEFSKPTTCHRSPCAVVRMQRV